MKEQRTSPAHTSGGLGKCLLKNLVAAGVAGLLIAKTIEIQPGYQLAYNGLLRGNMAFIKANPSLSLEDKFAQKLGSAYRYLQYVREQTPDTAVILYPSAEDFFPPDRKSPFTGEPYNKIWALRFLYPRRLVLPSEMKTNRWAGEITHVAIVNGRGFERVSYPVAKRFEFDVLPVHP